MQTIIQKWGNSLAIRIPRSFAKQTNISNGTEVDLSVKKNKMVISPVQKDNKYDLDSFLAEVDDSNIHSEVDFGEPVGKELI